MPAMMTGFTALAAASSPSDHFVPAEYDLVVYGVVGASIDGCLGVIPGWMGLTLMIMIYII